MTDLERCLAEQRRCRDELLAPDGGGLDRAGLLLGLADWTAEEVLQLT